jgi:hypothetical protein
MHEHKRHQLTDVESVLRFALAGKARLTLVSQRTGTRFTYEIKAPKNPNSVTHFVGVLTGSNNETDYTYMGQMKASNQGSIFGPDASPEYVSGRKSKVSPESPSAKAFRWFWAKLRTGTMPEGVEVWHEGYCGRCGRLLTVPESVYTGFGDECAAKVGVVYGKPKTMTAIPSDNPLEDAITYRRNHGHG